MSAYYNEFDPKAAEWLRVLMEAGEIAKGEVDERSICDVEARDLRGFTQCHFFAGIGVWSHALRRAGWPDDRPVWTGSAPCQPFSPAGRQQGFEDKRHLWPWFLRLIAECRPHRIFGEQSAAAGAWIDLVRADLENHGYAFGAPDLPAAGFGGSHIRQRFYWVADADNAERWAELAPRNDGDWPRTGRVEAPSYPSECRSLGGLADPDRTGCVGLSLVRLQRSDFHDPDGSGSLRGMADADGRNAGSERQQCRRQHGQLEADDCATCGLGDADRARLEGWILSAERARERLVGPSGVGGAAEWIPCADGRWRPVEPGTFPLASEASGRVGRLRGYGNALDAEAAVNFVGAFMEAADLRAS